jgi:hypothetical protein
MVGHLERTRPDPPESLGDEDASPVVDIVENWT